MNEVFKALSDPTRREILRVLREGPRTAGEIAELFPLAKSTLSGHFNVLKTAGLVRTEKEGTTITYFLNATVMQDALTQIMGFFKVGDGHE
ncbi:autorepressor SdpR family transcription factor [Deinococcus cellulosilyticus]|uniref:Transcriptional regulator n=1 Tax=Deinococcus cellulosilyticus (strain DSM 18568 / NBRC 106333 / KACC 11606 / 5516J-15) TaxID=1223518 RepID=A0A511N3N8_DEIC1|nr:autorepressor SdpR family transcription factor [Deinococcus cellulosilyticus]GEM47489.1 transcriptional regulator [Deinococcus cellulosilyticus NBRC 106333 = KACC 11606]